MNLSRYREYFPITQHSLYLNHAAISPLSTKVTDSIKDYLENRSSGRIDVFEDVMIAKERLKMNLGRLIGCQAQQLAIITNTSEGLNWLANGFAWQRGDRILLFRDDFPSNIYPFMNLQRLGVEIDFIDSEKGFTDLNRVTEKITPRTKILSVSFVKFYNGYRNDLQAISDLCRQKDVLISVDGIQGVGALPINVEKMRIDFLSNGGHKWLMSPLGCGFMYVSPQVLDKLIPAFAGWLSVKDSLNFLDYKLDFLDDASRFEIGAQNAAGITGALTATGILCEITPMVIQNHLYALGEYLIDKLESLGMNFTGNKDKKYWSGIYAFRTTFAEDLFQHLKKNRVHISIRDGALRISPHFYNTTTDMDDLYDLCLKFIQNTGRGHEE